MSLMGTIAAMFGSGATGKECVVDGDRLAGGDRVGPGERFQALNRLSRYATREELKVKVVFGGRPLREAGEGDTYNEVQVFYGETAEDVRKRLTKLSGAGTILITSDQALETEIADKGYPTMRLSTLRKAMEASSSENGGREGGGERFGGGRDRGDGGRRGGRNRNRGRGDRRPRQNEAPGQPGQQQSPVAEGGAPARAPEQPSSGGGSDNSVKNLIDLVE